MPEDYRFVSGGNRKLSHHPFIPGKIVQSNPLSTESWAEEGGPQLDMTRHTFSFQSPVFTKNISVTHFHHNPPVSVFSSFFIYLFFL